MCSLFRLSPTQFSPIQGCIIKKAFSIACAIIAPALISQSANAEFDYFKTDGSFKRFSVSVGWLHAKPSGDATPVKNSTIIKDGSTHKNGSVKASTVIDVLDPNQNPKTFKKVSDTLGLLGDTDLSKVPLLGDVSGETTIYGLENFATAGTGLESDNVNTVGMLFNYYINDNWGVELKAGIPPRVDILGKGEVIAPFTGEVSPSGAGSTLVGDFDIKKDIQITDLTQGNGVSASARAWLPAALVQYQFGKSGVNKFRPYVGVGAMYAYFNDIKMNQGLVNDLAVAGGRLQLIKDDKAGAALGTKEEIRKNPSAGVADMKVKSKADSAIAPIINVGATYDFNESWYAVGSLSYAKLDSDTTITVENAAGEQLIEAVSIIDIDPYISYLGVGYRF